MRPAAIYGPLFQNAHFGPPRANPSARKNNPQDWGWGMNCTPTAAKKKSNALSQYIIVPSFFDIPYYAYSDTPGNGEDHFHR